MTTSANKQGRGPLEGVRILDLTSVIMGPYATQLLADLGADVINVEPPGGNTARKIGRGPHSQLTGVALNLLRNKRNVALDLKNPAALAALHRVISHCDVVVSSMRPIALKRLGLTYEALCRTKPDIIFCQAHGFRQGSEKQDDPAYDDIIQAVSGLAGIFDTIYGRPLFVPTIIADKLCGMSIAQAILSGLYQKATRGVGDYIEIPMADVMTAFLLVEHGYDAILEPPIGPPGYVRLLTKFRRPYRTLDGWIALMPYSHQHFNDLFGYAGRIDLVGDDRHVTVTAQVMNADFLYGELEKIVEQKTTAELREFTSSHSIPFGEVASLGDKIRELPIAHHPLVGDYRYVPPPARFGSYDPEKTVRPARLIGEDTRDVLLQCGFSEAEILELENAKAFPDPPILSKGI